VTGLLWLRLLHAVQFEWDTNPGRREVQSISTSVFTGANEIQEVTTSMPDWDEVQIITTSATPLPEVQVITLIGASDGYFFLELDTTSSGGSKQYSGFVDIDYPASGDPYYSIEALVEHMSNVQGTVNATKTVDVDPFQPSLANYTYTITFDVRMGNVPTLKVQAAGLSPIGCQAVVETMQEGNVIGGTFRLEFDGQVTP
jgi:hypothetical protein